MIVFFFLNATATTYIYTYLHTLSLHDALPICSALCRNTLTPGRRRIVLHGRRLHGSAWTSHRDGRQLSQRRQGFVIFGCRGASARSEEHTSELQSLMRNSYAVFCLKKNTCHNLATHC